VGREESQQNTITTRNQSQIWHSGYPVVRPRPTLAYSTLWRPNGRGLQSTPLKRPKTHLNTTVFCLLFLILFARNLHNLEPLALTLEVHKEARSKGGISNARKTQKSECQHAHKSQQELTTQPNEFTTPLELYMLSQRNKCAESMSWCLGMLQVCFVCSSMRLGGPFYSPKAARSR
jgi:hypothetical protein